MAEKNNAEKKKIYKQKKQHPFKNQIFNHYKKQAKEINKAIELLIEHKYTVINHKGKMDYKRKH